MKSHFSMKAVLFVMVLKKKHFRHLAVQQSDDWIDTPAVDLYKMCLSVKSLQTITDD